MIPLYTSYLTPADYGVIELIELFVSVVGISIGFGAISDAMVRVHHECTTTNDRSSVVFTSLTLVLAGGALATVGAWIFARGISQVVFNSVAYSGIVKAAFLALTFGGLAEVALLYQRIRQRAVVYVIATAVQLGLNLGLNIYFIAGLKLGVKGFVAAKVISSVLFCVLLMVVTLRETGVCFKMDIVRGMTRFGSPLVASSIALFAIHFSDRFFISHFNNLADVGVYALAYKMGFMVTYLVGQPFGMIWNVSLYAHMSGPAWRQEYARLAKYLFFALVFVALGLSIFAKEFLALVVPEPFRRAAFFVPIIAFAYAFREVGDFFRGLLFGTGSTVAFSKLTSLCCVVNVALNLWLIPVYGPLGAAWSTLVTWLLYLALCWIKAQRVNPIPIRVRPIAAMSALAVAVYGLSVLVAGLPSLWQWAADAVLAAAFPIGLWYAGYLSSSEKAAILAVLRRRTHVAVATAD
jgi:O-antigen/teichoic acid export membrane protein